MTNDVFGCWYEPGDSGTWFTWFINQHKDYPQFETRMLYDQQGKELGHIPSDFVCYGADWFIKDFGEEQKFEFKDYRQHLHNNKVNHNKDYKHICYKILPWHNPFHLEDHELENETVKELASRIVKESNTKAVIIPQVEVSYQLFARRLAFIRPRFTVNDAYEIYKNRIARAYENTYSMVSNVVPVHTIAIDKLILRSDEDEYNKLLDILQVPALDNWKSLMDEYYIKILSPWEHVHTHELDNREETRKNSKENPYS